MPQSSELKEIGSIIHLRRGAQNAVRDCLAVTNSDKVTIICDEEGKNIAAAIATAVWEVGASLEAYILERHAPRPITSLPPVIDRSLDTSTVSCFIATAKPGEHTMRHAIIDKLPGRQLRHAHMVSITEDAMCQGMLSDYKRIAKLNPIMVDRISKASSIRVTSTAGTDVTVVLDPSEQWDTSAGIIRPGQWDNLPNGEILVCPKSVDGVFMCDSLPPTNEEIDRFELGRKPLRLHAENGRVVKVEGGPGDLANQVLANMRSGENMDRLGMFAVGTNYDLLMPIGDRLQDMFVPGAYFSLGRNPSHRAKPSWTSPSQFTFIGRKTTLELDGKAVILNGRYDAAILAEAK